MKPDMSTLRVTPWLPATALVLCDLLDHHTHELVPHAPRSVLKKQVERARAMGFEPMMATELEFYLFENSYEGLRDSNFTGLRPISAYNEDYHIFQTTKEEDVMRAVRNGLYGAGIPSRIPRARRTADRKRSITAIRTRSTLPTTIRSSRRA
jgi:glutamine synthetase